MDGSSGDNRYYRIILKYFFLFYATDGILSVGFWLTIFISGDIIFYVKGEDGEK